MADMPRPRPIGLRKEMTRHGKVAWYVRIGDGRRVRIRGEFGTPEFQEACRAAMAGETVPAKAKPSKASLEWLLARYRETTAWAGLSLATRRQREAIFRGVVGAVGGEPFAAVTKGDIIANRDRRASTPAQARNFLDAMRGLFRWALDAEHVTVDPTAGVKNPKRPKGGGFPIWTEDEVAAYEARWPRGTRERVWLDVLLYTGLRRGDAVKLGRQHVRDGLAVIRTEKTDTEVAIPILAPLAETLAAGPCGDLAFICGMKGRPFVKEAFGEAFRQACHAAGVKKSAHGLRKIGATRAAENGATVAELEAIFGWSGGGMAALYTRSANRRRLAQGAIAKLVRNGK